MTVAMVVCQSRTKHRTGEEAAEDKIDVKLKCYHVDQS
jgi:hypothetical protein